MPPSVIYYNSWSTRLAPLKSEHARVTQVGWWMRCLWPIIDRRTIKVCLISHLWDSKINADSIRPFDVQSCTLPWSQLVSLEWVMCIWIFSSLQVNISILRTHSTLPSVLLSAVFVICYSNFSCWKPEPNLTVYRSGCAPTRPMHWTSFDFRSFITWWRQSRVPGFLCIFSPLL